MNDRGLLKNRKIRGVLVLVAVATVSLAYLGDYFDGSGSWIVLQSNQITLVDVEGKPLRIRGDFRMSLPERQSLQNWLESQGFTLKDRNSGEVSSDLVYQGRYQNSLPIEVTIAAAGSEEKSNIVLSYKGHAFKRIFYERKKKVAMFSNEMLRICTAKVF